MKPRASLLLVILLLACGGKPAEVQTPAPTPVALPDGEGTYTLRFNRPQCLAPARELLTEVQLETGWERVALEDPEDQPGLTQALLTEMERAPERTWPVRAVFRSDLRAWGDHQARVLRLLAVEGVGPAEGLPTEDAGVSPEG